jgi:hypothetical protein
MVGVAIKYAAFTIPVGTLVVFVIAAIIAGMIAAIFPARRAGRLDVLELAAEALGRAGVEQDPAGSDLRRLVGVDDRHPAGARNEVARLGDRSRSLQRIAGSDPCGEPAVEHRNVSVAEVAKQPPRARRGHRGALVVDDDRAGGRNARRPIWTGWAVLSYNADSLAVRTR